MKLVQEDAQRHLNALRFGGSAGSAPSLALTSATAAALADTRRLGREQAVHMQHTYGQRPRTLANHQRAYSDFSKYCAIHFDSIQQGWELCRPDDVVHYMFGHLLTQRSGRGGGTISGHTLECAISDLNTCFKLLGRVRSWDDDPERGNPINSMVRATVSAYVTQQNVPGRRERSAVPVAVDHLRRLLLGLDSTIEASARSGDTRLWELSIRDAAALAYLFGGCRRGSDILYTQWEDLHMSVGSPPSMVPVVKLWGESDHEELGTVYATPSCSKVAHSRRPATQTLPVSTDRVMCPVRRLRNLFYSELISLRTPTGAIFRSSTGSRQVLTSQGLGDRVRVLVQRYGIDNGETMHGLRRGGIQYLQDERVPHSDVMLQASIVTPAVYHKYGDRARHLA